MKPLHTFAEKKEAQLSLAWLDECFQQPLDLIEAQAARLDAQSRIIAEQNTKIEALTDAVAKLGSTESLADRVIALLKGKKK